MSTYAKVCAANRTKTRSLLVLAALYVVIGLGLSIVSAVAGEPLGAFLGFLIVSCTIGGTVLLRAVWRLNAQAAAISDRLHTLASTTQRIERTASERDKLLSDSHDQLSQMLDLAAVGRGNPSALAAAVLDQATYPRLVKAMEEHAELGEPAPVAIIEPASITPAGAAPVIANEAKPPAMPEAAAAQAEAAPETPVAVSESQTASLPEVTPGASPSNYGDNGAHSAGTKQNGKHQEPPASDAEDPGPMSKVMMRRWKSAYREGDVLACREVFSVFEPIADADLVRSMREQLDEVVQRTERRLRLQFQQLVHEQRFEEALRVGDEMERVLPERPIAQEFSRIRPHIEKRARTVSANPVSSRVNSAP